jgi:hypothetical protein
LARYLDETYCRQIRTAGSHGRWTPDRRLAVGDFGTFSRGVFDRWASLKDYGFRVLSQPGAPSTEIIVTSGIRESGTSGAVGVSDPLDLVLSGNAELSYEVSGADEVLLLTQHGRWRELKDTNALLNQLRDNFAMIPLPGAVVCDVYQTPCALIGISSRSTTGFTIGFDANGRLSFAAHARGKGKLRRHDFQSVRRLFSLAPARRPARGQVSRVRYAPLFNKVFRTRKRYWGLFGRPELLDPEGQPISSRIDRSDPADLTYNDQAASVSLAEIQSIPVDELFEEVTPQLLEEEVTAEMNSELIADELRGEVTPQLLEEIGVEAFRYVEIDRADFSQVLEYAETADATADEAAAEESTEPELEDEVEP